MTVNVVSNLLVQNDCEALGDFVAHNISGAVGNIDRISVSEEEVPPKEGTYCYAMDIDIDSGGIVASLGLSLGSDWSTYQLYGWANNQTSANLASLNPSSGRAGIFMIVGDVNDNYGYWDVAGADTYAGGWACYTADLSASPDGNNGAKPNTGSVNYFGIGFTGLAKSKLSHNSFIDYLRVGNKGITVTTTSASVANFSRIAALDYSQSIGIVLENRGAYYVQGPIRFGSPVGSVCEFKDTNQVVFYADASASQNQYRMVVAASSTATTHFQMGELSGSVGIQGNLIKSQGTPYFKVQATNPNIDEFRLYGSTFLNASTFYLPDKNNASS
jgi:hypothetical protein